MKSFDSVPAGCVTLDLHGRNVYQAKIAIDSALRRSYGVCRLRVVHGYHNGTVLRDMVLEDYASHPRVVRITRISDGVSDLVLRET
ncbi:MAG: Smr/MutS family protein [Oscillospiraceae bacterium]